MHAAQTAMTHIRGLQGYASYFISLTVQEGVSDSYRLKTLQLLCIFSRARTVEDKAANGVMSLYRAAHSPYSSLTVGIRNISYAERLPMPSAASYTLTMICLRPFS